MKLYTAVILEFFFAVLERMTMSTGDVRWCKIETGVLVDLYVSQAGGLRLEPKYIVV